MTSDHPVKRRKKLIEVAIPLEAINSESVKRKRKAPGGYPTSFHKWWAQRPIAAARGVLLAQLIDDPGELPELFPTKELQDHERSNLLSLIADAVLWEEESNRKALSALQLKIKETWERYWRDNSVANQDKVSFPALPPFWDPFCGGGSIPLEAQRIGLEAWASDLNPIPILINKGLLELPSVMDDENASVICRHLGIDLLPGASKYALAALVDFYAAKLEKLVFREIGDSYPLLDVTEEMVESQPSLRSLVGKRLVVSCWIWARTVPSPSPAFSSQRVPLVSTFILSSRTGKKVWIEPIVDGSLYSFVIKQGDPPRQASSGTKVARGANFKCLLSGDLITPEYIKACSANGTLESELLAIAVDSPIGRVYLPPSDYHAKTAERCNPEWVPSLEISGSSQYMGVKVYGLNTFSDLFTKRQLLALNTLYSKALAMETVITSEIQEALSAGIHDTQESGSQNNPHLPKQLASVLSTYLIIAINRVLHYSSTACTWLSKDSAICRVFPKQAIQMSWDYAEGNIFGKSSASLLKCAKNVSDSIRALPLGSKGKVFQCDARSIDSKSHGARFIISTDPPYYDNVPYSDLSDFFYAWCRKYLSVKDPLLYGSIATPKADELVAFAHRHSGGRSQAESFFLEGMKEALAAVRKVSQPGYPVTLYYAFKQSESNSSEGVSSTGWETFLASVISAGFQITTTWPLRTEGDNRQRGVGANALATSILLVCTERSINARSMTSSEYKRELRQQLPEALSILEEFNIPPVDVAQAAIGPGMSIFSSAKSVLNPDDSPMSVREALAEINAALDEYLSHEEGDLDADSRFALTFFESFGYLERDYGDAEGLAVARNISVDGVAKAGILRSVAGKVRLLQRSELPADWDPTIDKRIGVWEATQQLIKRLEANGETNAASLLLQLKNLPGHGDLAGNCRALAYRLYNHCEKTKQAEEARSYNGLVIAWPELERQASASVNTQSPPLQTSLI